MKTLPVLSHTPSCDKAYLTFLAKTTENHPPLLIFPGVLCSLCLFPVPLNPRLHWPQHYSTTTVNIIPLNVFVFMSHGRNYYCTVMGFFLFDLFTSEIVS